MLLHSRFLSFSLLHLSWKAAYSKPVDLILCSALDSPGTLQVLSSSSTQQAEISIFLLPHALKNVTEILSQAIWISKPFQVLFKDYLDRKSVV